jgi:hypothetical protein
MRPAGFRAGLFVSAQPILARARIPLPVAAATACRPIVFATAFEPTTITSAPPARSTQSRPRCTMANIRDQ